MSRSNLDDHMDSVLDHPYVGAGQEEISLLEQADRERPVHWVGTDKAIVEVKQENPHWSQMPKSTYVFPPRELGDEMADHSDDQGYDNHEE